jgi:hypothetical protein
MVTNRTIKPTLAEKLFGLIHSYLSLLFLNDLVEVIARALQRA